MILGKAEGRLRGVKLGEGEMRVLVKAMVGECGRIANAFSAGTLVRCPYAGCPPLANESKRIAPVISTTAHGHRSNVPLPDLFPPLTDAVRSISSLTG